MCGHCNGSGMVGEAFCGHCSQGHDQLAACIRAALDEPQWIVDARWQAYFDQQNIENPQVSDPRLCPICSNLGWCLSSVGTKIQPCVCLWNEVIPALNPEDHGQRQLEAIALAKYGCNYRTIRAERATGK